MNDKKFEILKIVIGFSLAAIVGPLISKTFTHFDAQAKRLAASRERAHGFHDELVESAGNRVFWSRRLLAEVENRNKKPGDLKENFARLQSEYDAAVADWTATISKSIKRVEKTYPDYIKGPIITLNAGLGGLDIDIRRQLSDLQTHGDAGKQEKYLEIARTLANDIFDISFDLQEFIDSDEFANRKPEQD